MWIKKTEKEILDYEFHEQEKFKKTRVKKGMKFAIWTFVIYALLMSINYVLFGVPTGRYNPAPNQRIDWHELPVYLNEILVMATFISLLIFLVSFIWGKKIKSTTLMCDKCNIAKNYSDNKICECGGNFDFIEYYKWIEESK